MSKYVPPHLRRQSGAAANPTSSGRDGRSSISSSSSGPGNGTRTRNTGVSSLSSGRSRWNVDDRGESSRWSSDHNSSDHGSSRQHNSSGTNTTHHNNSNSSNSSNNKPSRWANVTDAGLRSDTHHRTHNHPNHSSSSSSSSRFEPSSALSSSSSRRPPLKIAFFGDSFVRLFGLVEHPTLEVKGFKGASAKGLGRAENENRDFIADFCQQQRRRGRTHHPPTDLECAVFCFGSVDVHLSFYYTRYVKGEAIDLDTVAVKYVDFVADLPGGPDQRIILGVYPSPLADEMVGPSLVSYGSLTEEQAAQVTGSVEATLQARQDRVRAFNRALQRRCDERQKDGTLDEGVTLEYQEINAEMTDASTDQLKDAFKDVSDHNIHIVWETTLLVWLEKWAWFRALTPPGFAKGLQRTLDDYVATKPWAERVHVAQNVGVQGAVAVEKEALS